MRINLQDFDGLTVDASLVSADKSPVNSSLVSENSQPIDQQTEKVATDQTKASTEKTADAASQGDYKEAIVGILNPKSDGDKKVTGSITFKNRGPFLAAVGKIGGFPDGGTIEFEGEEASSTQKDALVREMIGILERMIENKYSVAIKLEIKEKKL
jgi:hypothetical protein